MRRHLGYDASLRLGLDPASARVPFTEGLRLAASHFFRSLFMVIHLRHLTYLIPFIKDCTEPHATSYPIVVFLLYSLRESVAFHEEGLLVHELYFVLHCTPRFHVTMSAGLCAITSTLAHLHLAIGLPFSLCYNLLLVVLTVLLVTFASVRIVSF